MAGLQRWRDGGGEVDAAAMAAAGVGCRGAWAGGVGHHDGSGSSLVWRLLQMDDVYGSMWSVVWYAGLFVLVATA